MPGYGFWLAAISIGFVLLGAVTTFWPPEKRKPKLIWMLGFGVLGIAHVWLSTAQEDAAEQEEVTREARLERLGQELRDARSETSKSDKRLEDLQKFSIQKIADLQTEVRSEQLRHELEAVKRELVAVRTAPRARLEFGFEQEAEPDRLLHEITVPVVDRTARVRLLVRNTSGVNAEMTHFWIILPKEREITKEEPPVRLLRPRDAPANVRHFAAGDIPTRATLTSFAVDVSVSPEYGFVDVTFRYSCRTCISKDDQTRRVNLIWHPEARPTPTAPRAP